MKLRNENITVEIDDLTGATVGIYAPSDDMNWVLKDSAWGLVDGFVTKSVASGEDHASVITCHKSRQLEVKIEKCITKKEYFETYYITNNEDAEFFLTRENFGIPFPYDCLCLPKRDVLHECCISHVWCGGDAAWMYSVKCGGEQPYLSMHVVEGAIHDYSIQYDTSRTPNASYFRGVIVLHPRDSVILPQQTLKLSFRYRFVKEKPEKAPLDYAGAIRFSANKYTVLKNEEITALFESEAPYHDLTVSCDGKQYPYVQEGNRAVIRLRFDSVGERRILATANGKTTWIYINVISEVSEILQKRARFIAGKQQYHVLGSQLDGAYLIYDAETDQMYCDDNNLDHNAGRERIGMGLVVCRALQQQYDEGMMQSLRRHRAFVERELVDTESGMVYNHVGRNNKRRRTYNFPWFSLYYLEWYRLCGERACLVLAAKILLQFFEVSGGWVDAQCMEICDTCAALEAEGLHELRERLTAAFLTYADRIESSFWTAEKQGEISYVSEIPNDRTCYLAQAYVLTGEEKYLIRAGEYQKATEAFFAQQPDFHLNCINERHWDRYWFGKYPAYGDVFPHYWSALAAWCMNWYDKARGSNALRPYIESNLCGNLCVYRENGFASNNYLYPYKIVLSSPDGQYPNQYLQPGVFYGKKYDAWANDQDWALYYASRIL